MNLSFVGVSKSFGSRKILNEISFNVEPGEILFILGQSGMGKSVTLKHIVGLLRPDQGQILLGDDDVAKMDATSLARARRRCGMVFQHPALLDSFNIFQNVTFGLRTPIARETLGKKLGLKVDDSFLEKWAAEKLKLVHLDPSVMLKMPGELSYGMQKRASLARTLAIDPEILLFDEPTTGLDPITTQAVNLLIKELSRKLKVTSLVVSHDMECALGIADRILVLDQGKILALESPSEIRASKEPLIVDFLKEVLPV